MATLVGLGACHGCLSNTVVTAQLRGRLSCSAIRWLPASSIVAPVKSRALGTFESFTGLRSGALTSPQRAANISNASNALKRKTKSGTGAGNIVCALLPVDPWAPSIDAQSIASQLFAVSLVPYLGFLYHLTKSKTAPGLTLFGFYFLLAFVGATTKIHYGTSLSNVDYLHGSAESLLTVTNLLIVLGLRKALKKQEALGEEQEEAAAAGPGGTTAGAEEAPAKGVAK
eukprot:jgi/Mesen1/4859/ME000244S04043